MERAGTRTTAQKLGIRPEDELLLVGAPLGLEIAGLPLDAQITKWHRLTGAPSLAKRPIVVAFFASRKELPGRIGALAQSVFPDGLLWLAWPRRAGGHSSDITDNVVGAAALEIGIVDVRVAALNNDWSALCFVWRKELRKVSDTDQP